MIGFAIGVIVALWLAHKFAMWLFRRDYWAQHGAPLLARLDAEDQEDARQDAEWEAKMRRGPQEVG